MKFLLLLALPLAAQAQLVLVSVSGGIETLVPSGSAFPVGQAALGTTSTFLFRVYNQSKSSPVSITQVAALGAGFTVTATPGTPTILIPNSAAPLNITVYFMPTTAVPCSVSCSASLTVNSSAGGLSTILIGTGVPPLTLSSGAGCSSSVPFNWGNVTVGASTSCVFTLQNFNLQAITLGAILVNGFGFTGPYGIAAPLTLQPLQAIPFTVSFTPATAAAYSGSLLIGTQAFGLVGAGQLPPLPTPALAFDAGPFASGQQRVVTLTFPSAAPSAASGYVNLTFKPSTPFVADDGSIVFLAGSVRSLPFTVAAGSTTALLSGQGSAAFQTGTTEGTITFTVTSPQLAQSPAPMPIVIPGAAVIIEATTASKERTGYLDITITGADNTYSAGAMSFAFLDTSGKPISSATADFTANFKTYFGAQKAGSAFHSLVSFPVTGSVATIGSVTVTLTNAAGVASTGSLTFQ